MAHKLRDLNYAIEFDNTTVMKDLKWLIQEAMIIHKENSTILQRKVFQKKYEKILEHLLNQESIQKK